MMACTVYPTEKIQLVTKEEDRAVDSAEFVNIDNGNEPVDHIVVIDAVYTTDARKKSLVNTVGTTKGSLGFSTLTFATLSGTLESLAT